LRTVKISYVKSIGESGRKCDLIIIDGKYRGECVVNAQGFLSEGGIIVLDNSDQKPELLCGELPRTSGFVQFDLSGCGPVNSYRWSTSLFFKNGVPLKMKMNGPKPIKGLRE
jgi:hypothetical protein